MNESLLFIRVIFYIDKGFYQLTDKYIRKCDHFFVINFQKYNSIWVIHL
jgi:hypothetical protein